MAGTIVFVGAVVAALVANSDNLGLVVLFVGPPILGGAVALSAGAGAAGLALAAGVFVALGVAGVIAIGPDGRAEGAGALIVLIVALEIIGLYATAWIRRFIRRNPGQPRSPIRIPPP